MKYTSANKIQALEILLADPDLDIQDRQRLGQIPKPVFSELATLFKKYYGLQLFSYHDLESGKRFQSGSTASSGESEFTPLEGLKGYKALATQYFGREKELNQDVADRHFDGKFHEVRIGNTVWILENLNVDRFQDGTVLFHAQNNAQWNHALKELIPAYCYPDNNPEHGSAHGKFYNVHALKDSRRLLPLGWMLPADKEWTNLIKRMGGRTKAAPNMNKDWQCLASGYRCNSTRNQDTEPLFSFDGSGVKSQDAFHSGESGGSDCLAGFWTSTEDELNSFRAVYVYSADLDRGSSRTNGLSIRAIKCI